MRIVFITGQAGSGKDTLCHHLAGSDLSARLEIIWNGELVRAYAKKDTYFGNLVRENNAKGKLAPGFIMDMLVGQQLLLMPDREDGIIVWNGSPRTKNDEATLTSLMEFMGVIGEIIVLEVGDKECLRRVNLRQIEQNRPELTSKSSIEEKFGSYRRITRPMLYRLEKSLYFHVHWINAEQNEHEVLVDVLKALKL